MFDPLAGRIRHDRISIEFRAIRSVRALNCFFKRYDLAMTCFVLVHRQRLIDGNPRKLAYLASCHA